MLLMFILSDTQKHQVSKMSRWIGYHHTVYGYHAHTLEHYPCCQCLLIVTPIRSRWVQQLIMKDCPAVLLLSIQIFIRGGPCWRELSPLSGHDLNMKLLKPDILWKQVFQVSCPCSGLSIVFFVFVCTMTFSPFLFIYSACYIDFPSQPYWAFFKTIFNTLARFTQLFRQYKSFFKCCLDIRTIDSSVCPFPRQSSSKWHRADLMKHTTHPKYLQLA